MTRSIPRVFLAIGLSLPLFSTACILRGPSGIRRDVAHATGAKYDRKLGLTLGRFSLGLVRWGMKDDLAEGDQTLSLEGIRKVQIGVYEVEEGTWNPGRRFDPASLGSWEPVVAIHDAGDDVHVLYRDRDGRTTDMLIVVSDSEDLVIVRVKGDLDRFLETAVRYSLQQAGRPDLSERTIAEARAPASFQFNASVAP